MSVGLLGGVRSNVEKYVQTVPRRIKLSRAGVPFSKPMGRFKRVQMRFQFSNMP